MKYLCEMEDSMNSNEQIEIPKKFWEYYDLYRRGRMTVEEFSKESGLTLSDLLLYLSSV